MVRGTFEPDRTAVVTEHLERADVFVDIGANTGFYSCLAQSLGKYVVAIEPQEQNLRCLYASLGANGPADTEVFPVGLAGRRGIETLHVVSSTAASLVPGWAARPKAFEQSIPVRTLDGLLGSRFQGRKLLIKLDVGGFEYQVLGGCRGVLAMEPQPTWLIEICLSDDHAGAANTHYRETFAAFLDAGYQAVTADRARSTIGLADLERRAARGRSGSTGTITCLMVPRAPVTPVARRTPVAWAAPELSKLTAA